jgi:ornithine decarboxylase
VVLVAQKSGDDDERWVFLDVGVFTGLIEVIGEAVRYPMITTRDGDPTAPAIVAGPTCDSLDVIYERHPVLLPRTLTEGDRIVLGGTGAYTTTYSSIGFNGFEPLRQVILQDDQG